MPTALLYHADSTQLSFEATVVGNDQSVAGRAQVRLVRRRVIVGAADAFLLQLPDSLGLLLA